MSQNILAFFFSLILCQTKRELHKVWVKQKIEEPLISNYGCC